MENVVPLFSAVALGWYRVYTALREQLRVRLGRHAQLSAGVLDIQSVKTTSISGPRGCVGGKKVKGRKRHVLVDTQGLLLRAVVHPADVMDRDGVLLLLPGAVDEFPQLRHVWLDSGYNGRGKGKDWIEHMLDSRIGAPSAEGDAGTCARRPGIRWKKVEPSTSGFRVLPRRWVERTFAKLE